MMLHYSAFLSIPVVFSGEGDMVQRFDVVKIMPDRRGKGFGGEVASFAIWSLFDDETFSARLYIIGTVGFVPSVTTAEVSASRTASSVSLIAASLASFLLLESSAARFLSASCFRCCLISACFRR